MASTGPVGAGRGALRSRSVGDWSDPEQRIFTGLPACRANSDVPHSFPVRLLLQHFRKMASGCRKAGLGCKSDTLRHFLSYRQQCFMFLNCPSQTVDVSFRMKEQALVGESETAPAERTEEVPVGEEEVQAGAKKVQLGAEKFRQQQISLLGKIYHRVEAKAGPTSVKKFVCCGLWLYVPFLLWVMVICSFISDLLILNSLKKDFCVFLLLRILLMIHQTLILPLHLENWSTEIMFLSPSNNKNKFISVLYKLPVMKWSRMKEIHFV